MLGARSLAEDDRRTAWSGTEPQHGGLRNWWVLFHSSPSRVFPASVKEDRRIMSVSARSVKRPCPRQFCIVWSRWLTLCVRPVRSPDARRDPRLRRRGDDSPARLPVPRLRRGAREGRPLSRAPAPRRSCTGRTSSSTRPRSRSSSSSGRESATSPRASTRTGTPTTRWAGGSGRRATATSAPGRARRSGRS